MTFDIVLAGVGGQGVLSVAAVIASAAMDQGLEVKQAEVHGMAQRGGAVQASLRLADHPIASDMIANATASLVLSMEPLESLRYLGLLKTDGAVISAMTPLRNIVDYPPLDDILDTIRRVPTHLLIDADALARGAGAVRATNMVMVGAASRLLPIAPAAIERCIATRFAPKGQAVVDLNLTAYRAGRTAVSA
ncbi:MAG: indolepyruvate oxidoreductase subunit beta [Acidobacteria bacterium]|jgi:indolepyruvate ferredoxin oxidoreductase beta subunit|nr:indolepyruvate oxidoreductase subunit beta [Acidobacteriota bacterium]